MDFRANTGPYGNHSLTVPCNGPALSLPLYPCDNVDFEVTTYYSNICPNGAYQGYGAPKGNFAITMALAELAEQLQIDQLEIIERNRVHEGQELKILGAIGEGKAPTSVPSAASCALEEILRQGREMINGLHRNRKMVTGTSVAASPLSCRNRVSRISIRLTV